MFTLGLSEIQVGVASPAGVMPATLTKIGMTYKDSCKINQAASEATEHYEEGASSPAVRIKDKKIPALTFQLMNPDPQLLAEYVGGVVVNGKWGFDGTETVANKAIKVLTKQGLCFEIPNADIEAVFNAELSKKGIALIDFTVTPLSVTAGKAIYAYNGTTSLAVSPTVLSFTAGEDITGQAVTAGSTGNVTYASAPAEVEWITVIRSGKTVTVKVSENTNSEERTTNVTIVADGLTYLLPVTQLGI